MLSSYSTPFAIIVCVAIISFAGCAQMFNGNLSELINQPELQSDLPARTKSDIGNLKIDPLDFATDTTQFNKQESSGWGHVTNLPAMDSDKKEETKTPIIHLEPLRKEPNNQFQPIVQSQQSPQPETRLAASSPLQPIPPSIADSVASQPTAEFIEANRPGPAMPEITADASDILAPNPIRDLIQTQPLESLPAIPVAVAPAKKVEAEIETPIAAAIPQLDVVDDAFVSSQMELHVPPFANHPDSTVCEYSNCSVTTKTADTIETIHNNGRVESLRGLPFSPNDFKPSSSAQQIDNDFVEQLISSTVDPASIELPSAATTPQHVHTTVSAVIETPITWDSQLEKAISAFENEIQAPNADVDLNELSQGLAILRSLKSSLVTEDNATQAELEEYWLHQLKALNSIMESNDSDLSIGTTTATALSHLNRAAYQLRESANLKLVAPAFCTKVSGFGQYVTFDSTEFASDQRVLVYCEIENFTPSLESRDSVDTYQTRISSSYEITNANNQIVQSTKFPTVTDNARNVRNDFFMHLPIQFADLKKGKYELQVEVRDHGSGKTAKLPNPMRFNVR